MSDKTSVIFICTANAARSQMAEGLLRAKYGDRYEIFSAGTRQSRVSPFAIEVMKEIGIDISHHRSKMLDEFTTSPVDIPVTLCDNAQKVCPAFPCAKKPFTTDFQTLIQDCAREKISTRVIAGSGTKSLNGSI